MTSTSTSLHLPLASAMGVDGEGEEGGSSRDAIAGVLACACAGRVRRLVPHTILCPQVFRNFLEIVKHHWSVCCVPRVWCVGRVDARRGKGESPRCLEPAIIGPKASVEDW